MNILKIKDLEIEMEFNVTNIQRKLDGLIVASQVLGYEAQTFSDPGHTDTIKEFGTITFGPFKRIEFSNNKIRYNFIFNLFEDMSFKEAQFFARLHVDESGPIKVGKNEKEINEALDVMIEFLA